MRLGDIMANRKSISKKVRFDVFKRDHFTCQYCGRMAPDVTLECDHIISAAKGGQNEYMNLITSCYDCNRGKGAKLLTEDLELQKQKLQLKELSDKREQLQFLIQWREELKGLNQETVDFLANEINNNVLIANDETISLTGKEGIKKWLTKFSVNELLDAIEISQNQYCKHDHSGKITEESFGKFWDMIPRIAFNKRNKTPEQFTIENKAKYLFAVLRNRFGTYLYKNKEKMIHQLIMVLTAGANYKVLYELVSKCDNLSEYEDELVNIFQGL